MRKLNPHSLINCNLLCFISGITYDDFVFHQIQAAEPALIVGLDSHNIDKGQLVCLYADVCDIAAQEGFSIGPVFIYC